MTGLKVLFFIACFVGVFFVIGFVISKYQSFIKRNDQKRASGADYVSGDAHKRQQLSRRNRGARRGIGG